MIAMKSQATTHDQDPGTKTRLTRTQVVAGITALAISVGGAAYLIDRDGGNQPNKQTTTEQIEPYQPQVAPEDQLPPEAKKLLNQDARTD